MELFPNDAELLAIDEDGATGVPYIEAGLSPYHVVFRRMLHRLLLASQRANDLRVYQDGALTIGVRPGRCVIQNSAIDFTGESAIALSATNTHAVWLDAAGDVQTATTGFPADRSTFLPLAQVITDSSQITAITDHRGETFQHAPSLAALSIGASSDEIIRLLIEPRARSAHVRVAR